MSGFGPPDDDGDECGCTFGRSCETHARRAEESSRAVRREMVARGVDPDAQVDGNLAEILMLVARSRSLSQNQKDAIERIMFPLKGTSR